MDFSINTSVYRFGRVHSLLANYYSTGNKLSNCDCRYGNMDVAVATVAMVTGTLPGRGAGPLRLPPAEGEETFVNPGV